MRWQVSLVVRLSGNSPPVLLVQAYYQFLTLPLYTVCRKWAWDQLGLSRLQPYQGSRLCGFRLRWSVLGLGMPDLNRFFNNIDIFLSKNRFLIQIEFNA